MHFKEENVKKTATTEIDSVGEVFRFGFYLVIYFFRKKEAAELNKKENSLLKKSSRQYNALE